MFWYTSQRKEKGRKIVTLAIVSLVIAMHSSCGSPSPETKTTTVMQQFDLPSFFQQEIARLDSLQPKIKKTVSEDRVSETKELVIAAWDKELASFLAVDLNKPAYRGTYRKDSIGNTVKYTVTDPSLDLSLLEIVYTDQIPTTFIIKKSTKNLLYNTSEHLEYVKGKRYTIDKLQSVKMLGYRHYRIEGIIE